MPVTKINSEYSLTTTVQRAASLLLIHVMLKIEALNLLALFEAQRSTQRLREAGKLRFPRFGHARIPTTHSSRNLLGEGDTNSDMPTIFAFNFINLTIPKRSARDGGKPTFDCFCS